MARAIGARVSAVDGDLLDLEALQVEVEDIEFIDGDGLDGDRRIENVRIDVHIDRERVVVDVVAAVSECWVQRVADTREVRRKRGRPDSMTRRGQTVPKSVGLSQWQSA